MTRRYVRHDDDPQEPDDPQLADAGWGIRVGARMLAAVFGFASTTAIAVITWNDRYEVRGTDNDAYIRATLNAGLYTERLFMLACVIVIITAIYIGTRTGE